MDVSKMFIQVQEDSKQSRSTENWDELACIALESTENIDT